MKATLLVTALFATLQAQADQRMLTSEVFRNVTRVALVDAPSEVEACMMTVADPSDGADLRQRSFVEGQYRPLPVEVRTFIAGDPAAADGAPIQNDPGEDVLRSS